MIWYPRLQKSLNQYFDIKARTEKKKMEVARIYRLDSIEVPFDQAITPGETTARGDRFNNPGATFEDFAEYLEGFGVVGMPVVDETNDENLYNFSFSYLPEDPSSFKKELKELGLGIQKVEREVEVLVIYEDLNLSDGQ